MRRVVVILLVLGIVTGAHAERKRKPAVALLLPAGATAVGIVACALALDWYDWKGTGEEEPRHDWRVPGVVAAAGLLLGPSLGGVYVHKLGKAGLVTRVAGVVVGGMGVLVFGQGGGADPGKILVGLGVAGVGAAAYVVGSAIEIGSAVKVAARVRMLVVPAAGGAPGLSVVGAF